MDLGAYSSERWRGAGLSLRRMRLTLIGPAVVAGANFFYALVFIPLLSPSSYGFLAFALLLVQLGYNLSNALCAMPMAIEGGRGVFARIALILALASGTIVAGIGVLVGAGAAGVGIGLFAVIASLRWYGRTAAFTQLAPKAAAFSDIAYSVVLSGGAVFLHLGQWADLRFAAAGLTLAGLAGWVPLRRHVNLNAADGGRLADYLPIWRRHAGWALAQVLAMELTANAHAYVLVVIGGPTAYAILAVATVFWRPMSTVISAVAQSERPARARSLANDDVVGLVRAQGFVRLALAACYGINLLSIGAVLWLAPVVLSPTYEAAALLPAVALWGMVMGLRAIRMPATIHCQAGGQLKSLAAISLASAPVSLIGVTLIMLVTGDAVLSLVGVVLGEALQAVLTLRLRRGRP